MLEKSPDAAAPLAGLRVLDLTRHLAGAHATQLLADFGADVLLVERRAGSPLRSSQAFEFLARGKRSVVLDLRDARDRVRMLDLAAVADVVIDDFRPGIVGRLGLDGPAIAERNRGLVHASITGFGASGDLAGVPGYEALVMARIGALDALSQLVGGDRPAYAAVPYCSFSAGQTALHGILAALLERERSGRGQRVQTSLLQAIAGHDIWNWFLRMLTDRYPEAFTPAPPVEDGVPNSALVFRLLVALSADATWLQFSQTSRHLYVALMDVLGMGWMFDDPQWKDIPLVEDPAQRVELWDRMLAEVRSRSDEEWTATFDAHPDVWAERFRSGAEALDHPQLRHRSNVVRLRARAGSGEVVQPGRLAELDGLPPLTAPAPRLDEHAALVEQWAASVPASPLRSSDRASGDTAPLDGVTVLELGVFYAAPYASALLADLGARVVKVEPFAGDPLRELAPFPEVGAIKAMQGKESICVDLTTAAGREVVDRLAAQADIVLQSFRAGAAARLGVDEERLRTLNPGLVYVSAQGYGSDGPCGRRPAYAPTIAAASGIAWRMVGATLPTSTASMSLEDEKFAAVRLIAATNSAFAQCDGLGALANATAMLLGLVARARTGRAPTVRTSMLLTAAHANSEAVVRVPGRDAQADLTDDQLLGTSAMYRLYRAADGWVFLACPRARDWPVLADALAHVAAVRDDPRFADPGSRRRNDAELQHVLASAFERGDASEWEAAFTAAGIGCVAVRGGPVEAVMLGDVMPAAGQVVEVDHPMLGPHLRLAPLVSFSRSAVTPRRGCLAGEHTDAVLSRAGFTPDAIAALRASAAVA